MLTFLISENIIFSILEFLGLCGKSFLDLASYCFVLGGSILTLCLSVCLSVCVTSTAKTTEPISMKLSSYFGQMHNSCVLQDELASSDRSRVISKNSLKYIDDILLIFAKFAFFFEHRSKLEKSETRSFSKSP